MTVETPEGDRLAVELHRAGKVGTRRQGERQRHGNLVGGAGGPASALAVDNVA